MIKGNVPYPRLIQLEVHMKSRPHLNITYISERLKKALCDISQYTVTTVTAPMGYGKTTAISSFLKEAEAEGALVRRQSIYGNNLTLFWKSFCRLFSGMAIFDELSELPFPADENSRSFFLELVNEEFTDERPFYCFIDDLHLLSDPAVFELLFSLSLHAPSCLHLILVSRNPVFSQGEKLILGQRVLEIGIDDLSLTPEELNNYCALCGFKLNTDSLKILHQTTEGWFSCVYLNLVSYLSSGHFILDSASIYDTIYHVLLEPLGDEERKLLTILGMADEFTEEQAVYLWGDETAQILLKQLTENNSFISQLPDSDTFRCHHMLKSCTRQMFEKLPEKEQNLYQVRMGKWYQKQGYYEDAFLWLSHSDDYEALLDAVEESRGYALNIQHQEEVLRWLAKCPPDILSHHAFGILIFMRRLYTFRRIPEMLKLKDFFLKSVSENPQLTPEEKGNLLGECEVILSFLKYNDIQGMSLHHRKALQFMTRKTTSMGGSGSWTFGSPSVLAMYYRTPESLEQVIADMKECMPFYYQLTDGHGSGAEHLTEAEARFLQGNFADAELPLSRAELAGTARQQWGMLLCKDFLRMRLALFQGDHDLLENLKTSQRHTLKQNLQSMALNTLDMCDAFLDSLLGIPEQIPEWIALGKLESALVLHPAMPMLYMTYGQVLMAQGNFTRLIALEPEFRSRFSIYPNLLCTLYLEIQLAGSFYHLDDYKKALSHLRKAFSIGEKDGLTVPFAENGSFIRSLLEQVADASHQPFIRRIFSLHDLLEQGKAAISHSVSLSQRPDCLTENEWKLAKLAASRLSNREIASEMGFSEGTVKQYLNRIYGKLHIEGDNRNKRWLLEEYFSS